MEEHNHEKENLKIDFFKIICAIIFYVIAFIVKNEIISKFLFLISYFVVGYEVLIEAVKNIFKGEVFDENFLMSVATIRSLDYFRVSRSSCCYVVLSNWRIISKPSYK